MKTVLCVGASRLYAEGAASLLERCSDGALRVVAMTPGECTAAHPVADVLVIDLPAAHGGNVVRALRAANPQIQTIAVVDPAYEQEVIAYAHVGVSGYFTHQQTPAQMVSMLRDGGPVATHPIASALLREIAHSSELDLPPDGAALTRRELQVLDLIAEGLSNKEIARALKVGLPTVKNHVHQILSKARVRRRAQAVRLLRRRIELRRI